MMAATPTIRSSTLMLVLPLPIYRSAGRLLLDAQACNGLRLWLQNFDRVIMLNPLIETETPPDGLADLRARLPTDALETVPLPAAWSPLTFVRVLPQVRRVLAATIDRSTDLHFAIGGLWGDWGAVAALLAARAGRRAAVWTDRVESEVMRQHALRQRGPRRLYRRFNAALARPFERHVIRRTALGLFHGADCYRAYARFSRAPHLVHDIHLGPEARITPDALAAKLARTGGRVRLVYGGRLHPDKGVMDWVEVTRQLVERGTDFEATWHGDGPELEKARAFVAAHGLGEQVRFPGPTASHAALMEAFRAADLFLFCHRTPESPRCLVEALLSGTPIVGYDSAYAADLIAGHGGGLLVPQDPTALADAVSALAADPPRIAELTRCAAADGYPHTDVDVFRHRSELIKTLR